MVFKRLKGTATTIEISSLIPSAMIDTTTIIYLFVYIIFACTVACKI